MSLLQTLMSMVVSFQVGGRLSRADLYPLSCRSGGLAGRGRRSARPASACAEEPVAPRQRHSRPSWQRPRPWCRWRSARAGRRTALASGRRWRGSSAEAPSPPQGPRAGRRVSPVASSPGGPIASRTCGRSRRAHHADAGRVLLGSCRADHPAEQPVRPARQRAEGCRRWSAEAGAAEGRRDDGGRRGGRQADLAAAGSRHVRPGEVLRHLAQRGRAGRLMAGAQRSCWRAAGWACGGHSWFWSAAVSAVLIRAAGWVMLSPNALYRWLANWNFFSNSS